MGRRNSLTSMQRAQPRTLLPIAEFSWLCLHKCEVYLVTLEYGLITYYVKRYGDRRFDLDQWTTARARRRGDRIRNLLQCKCPLLMLWTAPPPARECHGCGGC